MKCSLVGSRELIHLKRHFLRNCNFYGAMKCFYWRSFKRTLPNDVLLSLFNLTDNPLECSCDLEWFVSYIKSKGSNIVSFPGETRCRLQNGIITSRIPLTDLVDKMPQCFPTNASMCQTSLHSLVLVFVVIMNELSWSFSSFRWHLFMSKDCFDSKHF